MSVPSWYALILLALAAFRTFRLIASDDILDRPRRYVTRLGLKWQKDGDPLPAEYRLKLADFLSCPYCAGWWLSLAWVGAWWAWPHGSLIAATPLAVSALLVAAERLISGPP